MALVERTARRMLMVGVLGWEGERMDGDDRSLLSRRGQGVGLYAICIAIKTLSDVGLSALFGPK